MKKYYPKTACQIQPKNKAEEAAQKYARKLDGTLLNGNDCLNAFIAGFEKEIEEINRQFPRCRDIHTDYKLYKEGGHWISAGDVARIDFYEVKQELQERTKLSFTIITNRDVTEKIEKQFKWDEKYNVQRSIELGQIIHSEGFSQVQINEKCGFRIEPSDIFWLGHFSAGL